MTSKKSKILPVVIGSLSIILVFVSIVLMPCPSKSQYLFFKIILSIGAAGVAAVIPGFLSIRYGNTISAGGALAVFVLVFKFNPDLVDTNDKCSIPLTYAIFLQDSAGNTPIKDKGTLTIKINSNSTPQRILNGKVTFTDIPPDRLTKTVEIQLEVEGWLFANNKSSIMIQPSSDLYSTLIIKRDNSLCCITGSIRDSNNVLLSDVNVGIGNDFAVTDKNGRFNLRIPVERQQEEYILTVNAVGYKVTDLKVYPRVRQDVEVILYKRSP